MKTRNLLFIAFIAVFTMSCNNKAQTEKNENVKAATMNTADASIWKIQCALPPCAKSKLTPEKTL